MSGDGVNIVDTPDGVRLLKQLSKWSTSPLNFAREAIGIVPSNQQCEAYTALARIVNAKMKRIRGEELGVLEKSYADKIGITIRAGRGVGKDTWLATVSWWMLQCFKNPKLAVTATSAKQIQDVFWSELSLWGRKSVWPLLDFFEFQSERVYWKDKGGKENHFLSARVANVKGDRGTHSAALSGLHSPVMMLMVDEASDIPPAMAEALEATLTGGCNVLVLIGNMLRNSGYFYDTHFNPNFARYWERLHWDAEFSNMDHVSGGNTALAATIDRIANQYGKDSTYYKVNVKGDPPGTDPDALIPFEWVKLATQRDIIPDTDAPTILGVDVARHGEDKSIILTRKGNVISDIMEFNKINTMELVGWINQEIKLRDPVHCVCIDMIGIGAGVHDRLKEQHPTTSAGIPVRIYGVNVAEKASNNDKFRRLRDELWWRAREMFEKGNIKIPDNEELIGELSSIKYKPESDGKVAVEGKPEMKSRGLKSPNIADALCLSLYPNDMWFYKPAKKDIWDNIFSRYNIYNNNSHNNTMSDSAWMSR